MVSLFSLLNLQREVHSLKQTGILGQCNGYSDHVWSKPILLRDWYCSWPFRPEGVRLWPQSWIPVKDIHRDHDGSSFRDYDTVYLHGGLCNPFQSITEREEPLWLIECHIKVLHLHQRFIRWPALEVWMKRSFNSLHAHVGCEHEWKK